MEDSNSAIAGKRPAVDADRLVGRLANYVNTASPTGSELGLAQQIAADLEGSGARVIVQHLGGDRGNVIARLRTGRPGPVVMLNGHLDTSYTGTEPELEGRGYKNEAIIDGDWMYGNGVHNMKNALASYAEAMHVLVESGEIDRLVGEVLFLGVAGEIEKAPYGRYQGDAFEGYGVGTSYALAHGVAADCCILGEPTANTIGLSNMGVVWARLRTEGTMAHTQSADRAENAITKMRIVLTHLEEWMAEHRVRREYKGVQPAADVTAIEGGWPYRASRTPVFCEAYLCVRIPPGVRPIEIYRELQEQANGLANGEPGIDVDVDLYVTQEGAEIEPDEPVVDQLVQAHRDVVGEEPAFVPRGAFMDSSTLVAHGIPTVVYGASGRVRGSDRARADWNPAEGEHTYLPDLVQSTQVVLETVRRLCTP